MIQKPTYQLSTDQKKRLEIIDKKLKELSPECRIDTGIRYARWAIFSVPISEDLKKDLSPDFIFEGMVCSTYMRVLMFCPYF